MTVLTNNNYSGATFVGYQGVLAIPTIANGGAASPIGTSSSDPANLVLGYAIGFGGRGDLMLTGTAATYSTDRGATVRGFYNFGDGGGAIGVQNAGTTLTWNGPITGPGELIKSGAGTLVLTNTTNSLPGRNCRRSGPPDRSVGRTAPAFSRPAAPWRLRTAPSSISPHLSMRARPAVR